ncbi:unnamed protein product [Echinostoma caproni]|uniref:Leishmanolysin-like peptidase n=1 Tax=Echinostoma caproni TaxID=27848 RepID=A0A183A9S1_9TREM|nr:unnamed protein product [Echinostoma caproni]
MPFAVCSVVFLLRFYALLIHFTDTTSVETLCRHEIANASDIVTRVALTAGRLFVRQSPPDQLRIHIHYDQSIQVLEEFDHVRKCRSIVNGSYVLSNEQGQGLENTDFVLYIAVLPTARCTTSKVLGYASHCQLAAKTDRPIAGYINFCPGALSQKPIDSMRSLFIAKHELLHALGFSSSLFAMYRDPLGRPLTPRDPKTQLPALGWSHSGAFFNCPTLDGVELEDQDEPGVFLTHWEKRILENELMTATYTNSYRVSPITLAMMEDTGLVTVCWYLANYSMSHDFSWGRGRGCAFATASCLEYMLEQKMRLYPVTPFCQQVQPPPERTEETGVQVSCTPDGVSYGFCNLMVHSKPLAPQYVYFVQTKQSGRWSPVQPLSILELGNGQRLSDSRPLDYVGGKIALANYCPFFQFRCSRLEGGLVIELEGGLAIPCTIPGRLVSVKACLVAQGYTIHGSLVCPDCRLLCDVNHRSQDNSVRTMISDAHRRLTKYKEVMQEEQQNCRTILSERQMEQLEDAVSRRVKNVKRKRKLAFSSWMITS